MFRPSDQLGSLPGKRRATAGFVAGHPDGRPEGPVRSDLTRLLENPEHRGWQVPVCAQSLSCLLTTLDSVVGCSARKGAVITDIGGYGLLDTRLAASDAIALELDPAATLHGLVCEAMPKTQLPPTLHLFDRNGRSVHRIHGTSAGDCQRILGFSGVADESHPAPFARREDSQTGRLKLCGTLATHNLFDLLDFVNQLRMPVLKWVAAPLCRQSHYGAIDNLWWRAGNFRLKSSYCTFSCDLTFAASINIYADALHNMSVQLCDEAGLPFAGFGQAEGHSERARTTWNNLLKGLCRTPGNADMPPV